MNFATPSCIFDSFCSILDMACNFRSMFGCAGKLWNWRSSRPSRGGAILCSWASSQCFCVVSHVCHSKPGRTPCPNKSLPKHSHALHEGEHVSGRWLKLAADEKAEAWRLERKLFIVHQCASLHHCAWLKKIEEELKKIEEGWKCMNMLSYLCACLIYHALILFWGGM